jgi:hypothetical protein
MELKDAGARGTAERLHYARALDAGMKIGLAVLAGGFLLYAFGWVSPLVPLDVLPRMWILPVGDYLQATGMPRGWGWIALLGEGDVLALLGIAVLAAVPLVSLLALIPLYAGRRDWIFLFIVTLQIGVIALAASGVLAAFH